MIDYSSVGRILFRCLCFTSFLISLAIFALTVAPAWATTTAPILWTAGGLSAGTDGAGQAARIASDSMGNVAVVSGPSRGRDLAITSYTADGKLRWRSTASSLSGTFIGDWVADSPNGDFVVIGHNQDSRGRPITCTMLRYDTNGMQLWRLDFSSGFYPNVARLVVDGSGNAYVAWSAVGSGFSVQKYSPFGTLLWSQSDSTGNGYAIASSLALSPDGAQVAVTGSVSAGATWITAVYDTSTGVRSWQVAAPEGTAARDVVVDSARVYVTGQGVTGGGTPAIAYFMTVVGYDRVTGSRLWRTDKKPLDSYEAAGLWMASAPDGSVVATGQAARGFLDWYTVNFDTTGAVRWEAVRDGGLNTDEIPRSVLVLSDGTTVVTGPGGPNLPGGYIQGVTAGYSRNGTLLWEGFSRLATVWATALPSGDVCTTGGYDALITCFDVPAVITPIEPVAIFSAIPTTGVAPLNVVFDGRQSTGPNALASWNWSFGDGAVGTGDQTTHLYSTSGTYTASLVVTDIFGLSSFPRNVSIVVSAPVPPAAPTNLTATALSRSSIRMGWTNGSTNQAGIRIERCKGTGCTNFTRTASVEGTATTYIDSGLAANTTYLYRVRAYNSAGDSPYSNIATARTPRRQ